MTISEQTHQKLERVIRKISQKFPNISDTGIVTDIHLRVVQDSGELLVFDDEENEITRCVVEQWIDNKDDCFYADVVQVLRKEFQRMSDTVDKFGILKPFSVVLENEEHENVLDRVSFAVGSAVYDKEKDHSFKDVFERADKKMYEAKQVIHERDGYAGGTR